LEKKELVALMQAILPEQDASPKDWLVSVAAALATKAQGAPSIRLAQKEFVAAVIERALKEKPQSVRDLAALTGANAPYLEDVALPIVKKRNANFEQARLQRQSTTRDQIYYRIGDLPWPAPLSLDAVKRVKEALEVKPMTLIELAKELKLSKSTVYYTLATKLPHHLLRDSDKRTRIRLGLPPSTAVAFFYDKDGRKEMYARLY
jgi:DNA-binding transcriptional ArsR family regulator